MRKIVLLIALCSMLSQAAFALVVDFDDLDLAAESQWHGPDPEGQEVDGPYGTEIHGLFTSHGTEFVNQFDTVNESWTGFAYSNQSDTQTPGYQNQFSAVTGTGVDTGADAYGVAYGYLDLEPNLYQPFAFDPANIDHLNRLPCLDLPANGRVETLFVTNTTYAVRSMQTGDTFAKKFGGDSGEDPDWFKLSIYGSDVSGEPLTRSVEFYLADFRSLADYIVTSWTQVDLEGLENATRLHFNLSSSDVGLYGLNTPAYFAIDNLLITHRELAGDFDADDDVDGHDFLLWQRQYGNVVDSFTGADADGDGQVGTSDLVFWQENYSQAPSVNAPVPGSTTHVIPEPSALLLALCALAYCSGSSLLRGTGLSFFPWRYSS